MNTYQILTALQWAFMTEGWAVSAWGGKYRNWSFLFWGVSIVFGVWSLYLQMKGMS